MIPTISKTQFIIDIPLFVKKLFLKKREQQRVVPLPLLTKIREVDQDCFL
jgi:hypothetical protein